MAPSSPERPVRGDDEHRARRVADDMSGHPEPTVMQLRGLLAALPYMEDWQLRLVEAWLDAGWRVRTFIWLTNTLNDPAYRDLLT
jgi:hypothetical protein